MILSCASNLRTRRTVWVARPSEWGLQSNAHNTQEGWESDGLPACTWAALSTPDWGWQELTPRYQSKEGAERISFDL